MQPIRKCFLRIVNGSFIILYSELINQIWTLIQPIKMYPDSISISAAYNPTITQGDDTMYFLEVAPEIILMI